MSAGRGVKSKPTCSRGRFRSIRGGITGCALRLTSGVSSIDSSSIAERISAWMSVCCMPTKLCTSPKSLPTKSAASRLPRTKRAFSSTISPTLSKVGRSAPLAIVVLPATLPCVDLGRVWLLGCLVCPVVGRRDRERPSSRSPNSCADAVCVNATRRIAVSTRIAPLRNI